VPPGTPRAKSSSIWDQIGNFFKVDIPHFFVSGFHSSVNKTIYSLLPRKSTAEKLAGCMDSLIDEVLNGGGDSEWNKLAKKIADIDMRTCGLDRKEIFREQIFSKLRGMRRGQVDMLCNKLPECKAVIKDEIFLPLMEECLTEANTNDHAVRRLFDGAFSVKGAIRASTRPTLVLSLPARKKSFPVNYLAVGDLAEYVAKKMNSRELFYLSRINVEAFPADQKHWAFLCCEAAKHEIAVRDIPRKNEAAVSEISKKIQGSARAFGNEVQKLVSQMPDGSLIHNEKSVSNLASLAMSFAQKINCLGEMEEGVRQAAVKAAVFSDTKTAAAIKTRAAERVGDGSTWKREIGKAIDAMNARQVAARKPAFNFNPKSIPNPVEPKALVDMIFNASLEA
jgi:hypothetical protein